MILYFVITEKFTFLAQSVHQFDAKISTNKESPVDDDRNGVRKAFSSTSPFEVVIPTPNSTNFLVVTVGAFSFLATLNHRKCVRHFVMSLAFPHEHIGC